LERMHLCVWMGMKPASPHGSFFVHCVCLDEDQASRLYG